MSIQNEPIGAKRRVPVVLVSNAGQGVAGQAGLVTVKIAKDGGAWAAPDPATTFTEDASSTDGDYTLSFALADWATSGLLKYKITGPNTREYEDALMLDPNASIGLRYSNAQGGAAGSITLDAGASSTNNFYAGGGQCCVVKVVAGTGAGQARLGTSYTGSTKIMSVTPNWVVTPDATSVYELSPYLGQLDAGTITSIQSGLATDAHVLAVPAAILTSVLGTQNSVNRTVQGVLRRLDWMMVGGGSGILSSLAKFFQYDGVTTAFQSVQDPTGGTRASSTAVAGD